MALKALLYIEQLVECVVYDDMMVLVRAEDLHFFSQVCISSIENSCFR